MENKVHEEETAIVSRTPVVVKIGLLGALLVQNTLLNVAARRSRVQASKDEELSGCGFLTTTSVVTTEVLKLGLSFLLLHMLESHGSLGETVFMVGRQTRDNPTDGLKIVVPAACYVVSNNLVLISGDYLEAPLLVLFGGLRILAVGMCSVALLRRELGARRWTALLALTTSIVCVQLDKHRASADHAGDEGKKNLLLGLAVAALACAVSGFAGVYFELVLKNSPISVWVRNLHLAAISLPFATMAVLTKDRDTVSSCGFFAGYGGAAWTYVAVKAAGGLLIAAVIKHADNLLKCFATAASVVSVAIISALLYNFHLSPMFFLGASGVVYSTLLYGDALKDLPGFGPIPTFLGGRGRRICCGPIDAVPYLPNSLPKGEEGYFIPAKGDDDASPRLLASSTSPRGRTPAAAAAAAADGPPNDNSENNA
ncbi:hypothetical protein CTAYLR_008033 [Chrysophaeum taylorii]|uniref:Uncharacterized protein n=1 Tax=Chrysophaeum taylorii TaxID=2483200 RepID=A0AAD7U8S6_9STRA|nr:hypothetical protein CTAYLR_008033 [Chrysophaeum taylorii]